MNKQLIDAIIHVNKKWMNLFSFQIKSHDARTDETKAYTISIRDDLKEYNKTKMTTFYFKAKESKTNDELRYEHQRENISCPLRRSVVCRVNMAQHPRQAKTRNQVYNISQC